MERPIDFVFFIFFVLEIPLITLLDSQIVFPKWIYPTKAFGKGYQLYTASEIVIRLQGQLNIDAGLVNQNDDPTLRRQLTSCVSTIFALTICVLAGYRQFQTNKRASRAWDFMDWYSQTFRDPLIRGTPGWYVGLFTLESFLQLPILIMLVKVFWQGVSKHKWIRAPALIYATNMSTICFAVLYHICLHDFLDTSLPAPRDSWERFLLALWYIPFFTVPFMLVIDASFSSVYREKQKRS